jgi:hypothetical protein
VDKAGEAARHKRRVSWGPSRHPPTVPNELDGVGPVRTLQFQVHEFTSSRFRVPCSRFRVLTPCELGN